MCTSPPPRRWRASSYPPLSVPHATLSAFPLAEEHVVQNFKVTWVQAGRSMRSGVAYDKPSAEDRKARLGQEDGVTDVQVVEVKPGE